MICLIGCEHITVSLTLDQNNRAEAGWNNWLQWGGLFEVETRPSYMSVGLRGSPIQGPFGDGTQMNEPRVDKSQYRRCSCGTSLCRQDLLRDLLCGFTVSPALKTPKPYIFFCLKSN